MYRDYMDIEQDNMDIEQDNNIQMDNNIQRDNIQYYLYWFDLRYSFFNHK